jgi:hypothetical protein
MLSLSKHAKDGNAVDRRDGSADVVTSFVAGSIGKSDEPGAISLGRRS